jgi:NAD(P)-dependent dehydrogenase (short-subunit alcohol dehydrogenase family)
MATTRTTGAGLAGDAVLRGDTVLVIGRGSGIARAIVESATAAGAAVVVAGRDRAALADAYRDNENVRAETVDVTDESSIAALAGRLGAVDHVVSTASARARGLVADLDRESLRSSFDTKVIGPIMLAKHLTPTVRPGGSFVLFSGVAAFKPAIGYLGVAATNGAVDYLVRSLALELAPLRVNAVSPGVIDTGAWDGLGNAGKKAYFEDIGARNPAGRIGTVEDVAHGVMFAMTNTFMTGMTLRIDGGEPLT